MLQPEIIKRLNNDEDPLDLAIEKYERFLERIETCQYIDEKWLTSVSCPLCHIYCCLEHGVISNYGRSNKICLLQVYGDYCNETNSLWNRLYFAVKYGTNDVEDCCKDMLKRLKQIRDMINNEV